MRATLAHIWSDSPYFCLTQISMRRSLRSLVEGGRAKYANFIPPRLVWLMYMSVRDAKETADAGLIHSKVG